MVCKLYIFYHFFPNITVGRAIFLKDHLFCNIATLSSNFLQYHFLAIVLAILFAIFLAVSFILQYQRRPSVPSISQGNCQSGSAKAFCNYINTRQSSAGHHWPTILSVHCFIGVLSWKWELGYLLVWWKEIMQSRSKRIKNSIQWALSLFHYKFDEFVPNWFNLYRLRHAMPINHLAFGCLKGSKHRFFRGLFFSGSYIRGKVFFCRTS